MSRRGVKVPHVPRSFIVPRDMCIPTPAGLTLAALPLHLLGVDQWQQSRSFSAASWSTQLAPVIQLCVMVAHFASQTRTAPQWSPNLPQKSRKLG